MRLNVLFMTDLRRKKRRVTFVFRILLFSCLALPVAALSQDLDARSPKPNSGSVQQRKAEKKKAKQAKLLEKAIKKGKKRHMKIQSRQTKKMMRKSKKSSKQWNQDRKGFFLTRWFRKEHH